MSFSYPPTSPRSLPPESVLLKLREGRPPHPMAASPPAAFQRCNTMVAGDAAFHAHSPMRKRCFSEVRPRVTPPLPQSGPRAASKALAIPPPFALGESIARSAERLAHLHQELGGIHANLDGHVSVIKRQLSLISHNGRSDDSGYCPDIEEEEEEAAVAARGRCACSASIDSTGSQASNPRESGPLHSPLSEEELAEEALTRSDESCREAVRDLEAADAAWAEFRLVLSEVGAAVRCEERHMAGRATWLDRKGKENFEKMSRTAVDKLKLTRQCAEEEE